MQCPIDGTTLVMTERRDVEIDYCPDCRGVWLDRGELEKLLRYDRDDDDWRDDRDRDDRGHDDRWRGSQPNKRKRKGWLSEMFEFGD